jgi:tetratricopeptide (TPR) repeat protein
MQVIDLSCPGCGAGVSTANKVCKFCRRPIVISSFSSMSSLSPLELNKYALSYRKTLAENPDNQEINGSIAMCYLKLQLYDNAIKAFEKTVEENFDNSETFYYAAVALLKGRKAFVTQRANVDKAMEYLNAALMVEPRGIYYYFLAYIKYDYFERKYLNVFPNWQETLQTAQQNGASQADIAQFFEILQVEQPECLMVC